MYNCIQLYIGCQYKKSPFSKKLPNGTIHLIILLLILWGYIMKKKILALFVLILFIFLAACQNEVIQSQNKKETDHSEVEEEEQADAKDDLTKLADEEQVEEEEDFEKLTDEEAQKIIQKNLKATHEIVKKLVQENQDWYTLNYEDILSQEGQSEEVQEALTKVEKALAKVMTEKALENKALTSEYLYAFTCQCDSFMLPMPADADVQFRMEDQTETTFTATSLIPHTEGPMEVTPGTYTWHFIKEDGVWKYDEITFVSADEEPFDLTFEDVKQIYSYYSDIELLDEVEDGNDTYFIIKTDDFILAVNKHDSRTNYELAEKYQ